MNKTQNTNLLSSFKRAKELPPSIKLQAEGAENFLDYAINPHPSESYYTRADYRDTGMGCVSRVLSEVSQALQANPDAYPPISEVIAFTNAALAIAKNAPSSDQFSANLDRGIRIDRDNLANMPQRTLAHS